MGAQVHLRLTSDKFDIRRTSPFLGCDFCDEIIKGEIWSKHESFLNIEECKILEAPFDESFDEEFPSPINPKELIEVMVKVKNYLNENKTILPVEIEIDYEKMEKEGLRYNLKVNGSRCWVQGYSLHNKKEDRIRIVNFPMEPHDVEMFMDYKDNVIIEGQKYYMRKISRLDKYSDSIDEVIAFCDSAVLIGDEVYWYYSH